MEQLLNINSIPISVEIVMNNAQLKCNHELPKVELSRQSGGLTMKADPIKINVDSFKTRQSIGLKSNDTLIKDYANEGIKVAYKAIARIVDEGNSLADPKGMTPAEIAATKLNRTIETVMAFLPEDGPDISWDGGTLNIKYQMDKINAKWDTNVENNFEFIPGKIEFEIKQKPSVDIEYIGGPIYVPPSANPNYSGQEIDIQA